MYTLTMSINEQLGRRIVSQFMYPRGLPGRLVARSSVSIGLR